MADVGITVAVGGDAKGFEAALNKARALGKGWAQQTAAENRTAADATGNAWGGGFAKAGRAAVKFGGVIGVLPQAAQQAIGAISAVFTSGLGPIGAAFAALAVAGVNIWRTMEAEAKAAADRIASIYKDLGEKEEAMRERNSLDPVKRAKSRLVMGDVAGAESERDALRKSAVGLAALSKGDSLGARQGRIEAMAMSNQAEEIDMAISRDQDKKRKEQGERDAAAFKKRQDDAFAATKRKKDDEERARQLVESRRAVALASAKDDAAENKLRRKFLGEDYNAAASAGRTAAARGDTAGAVDAQIKMKEAVAAAIEIRKNQLKSATDKAKDREKLARESSENLAIARAKTETAGDRLKIGFLGQDYRRAQAEGRAAYASGDTEKAVEAQVRMQKDMAEALTIWRQIRKNTESTKQ